MLVPRFQKYNKKTSLMYFKYYVNKNEFFIKLKILIFVQE